MSFLIACIVARVHDTSFGGYPWKVEVTVKMPAAEWTRRRNRKELGQLYGIDISNQVYAMNRNIPAHNPTVDDRERARAGVKTIRLTYFLKDPDRAESLGLVVKRLKSGEFIPGFDDAVRVA